jgi:hypothetical protein
MLCSEDPLKKVILVEILLLNICLLVNPSKKHHSKEDDCQNCYEHNHQLKQRICKRVSNFLVTRKMTKEFVKITLPALFHPDRYGSGCFVTGLIRLVFTFA